MQITCYSLITNLYADQVIKYIAYIEIAIGIGLSFGPTIGSIVYTSLKFEGTMILFACICFFGTFLCIILLPQSLNKTLSKEEKKDLDTHVKSLKDTMTRQEMNESIATSKPMRVVGWYHILTDKDSMFALMVGTVGTMNCVFWSGGYTEKQVVNLGLDESKFGYVVGGLGIIYLICCLLLPFTCEHSPRKLQFVVAMATFGICAFLIGPSHILNLPNSYITVCIGILL